MSDRDDFDLPQSSSAPESAALVPPADLLSSDKVAAVRFHPTKPGYAYNQVEIFVEQVLATLAYLEQRMHQDSVTLYEARDEIAYLQEKVMTLQATIEVFRAKGDPVTAADGSYVTESQVASGKDLEVLRQDRDRLAAELEEQKAETARAWAAEDELRRYLDEQLAPWIAAVTAQQSGAVTDKGLSQDNDAESQSPVNPETPADEIIDPGMDLPSQNSNVEPDDAVMLPADDGSVSNGEDLDSSELAPLTADEMEVLLAEAEEQSVAPTSQIGESESTVSADESGVSTDAVDDAPDGVPAKRSKRLLAQAPEVVGMGLLMDENEIPDEPALGESSTPPPAGAPIPRLLAQSPEVQILQDTED